MTVQQFTVGLLDSWARILQVKIMFMSMSFCSYNFKKMEDNETTSQGGGVTMEASAKVDELTKAIVQLEEDIKKQKLKIDAKELDIDAKEQKVRIHGTVKVEGTLTYDTCTRLG